MTKKNYLFILFSFMLWTIAGTATAQVTFRATNIRTTVQDGVKYVSFDIVAKNTSNDKVVTKIYDLSCTISADAIDNYTNNVVYSTKWANPSKFQTLNLNPGESVKNGFKVKYTSLKNPKWKWEGEEKANSKFQLKNIKISKIKSMKKVKDKSRRIIIIEE